VGTAHQRKLDQLIKWWAVPTLPTDNFLKAPFRGQKQPFKLQKPGIIKTKFFEKAKQASPSGCVPDCYMKNCQ
jgi:hypothetical protein